MTTPLTITLKNIKHSPSLSQETEAFTADIYVDGKKAGSCENHGQGGATNIFPYALCEQLDAYGATLPEVTSTSFGSSYTYKQTAETLVDDLLAAHLTAKEAKQLERDFLKSMATRLVVLMADGSVRQTKAFPAAQLKQTLDNPVGRAQYRAKFEVNGARILNLLPVDEARIFWMKGVGA